MRFDHQARHALATQQIEAPEPIAIASSIHELVEGFSSPAEESERRTQSYGCTTWPGSGSARCASSQRARLGEALVKRTSPRIRGQGSPAKGTSTSPTRCSCWATGPVAIWSWARVPVTEGVALIKLAGVDPVLGALQPWTAAGPPPRSALRARLQPPACLLE